MLTKREKNVLQVISEKNLTDASAIAEALGIRRSTANRHLGGIYRKTGAKTMPQLLLMLESRITSPIDLWDGRRSESVNVDNLRAAYGAALDTIDSLHGTINELRVLMKSYERQLKAQNRMLRSAEGEDWEWGTKD